MPAEGVKGDMPKPSYAGCRHGGPPKADLARPPMLQRASNPNTVHLRILSALSEPYWG